MNPLTNLHQLILIGELGRITGMFLAWFKNSKTRGLSFIQIVYFPDKAGFPIVSKSILTHEEQTKMFFFLNMFFLELVITRRVQDGDTSLKIYLLYRD